MDLYVQTYNITDRKEQTDIIRRYLLQDLNNIPQTLQGVYLKSRVSREHYMQNIDRLIIKFVDETTEQQKLQLYGFVDIVMSLFISRISFCQILEYLELYDQHLITKLDKMFKICLYPNRQTSSQQINSTQIQIDPELFIDHDFVEVRNDLQYYQRMLNELKERYGQDDPHYKQIMLNLQVSRVFLLYNQYIQYYDSFEYLLEGCKPFEAIPIAYGFIHQFFDNSISIHNAIFFENGMIHDFIKYVTYLKPFFDKNVLNELPVSITDWEFDKDKPRIKIQDPINIPSNTTGIIIKIQRLQKLARILNHDMLQHEDLMILIKQWGDYISRTDDIPFYLVRVKSQPPFQTNLSQDKRYLQDQRVQQHQLQQQQLYTCQVCFSEVEEKDCCYYICQIKIPHFICKCCLYNLLQQDTCNNKCVTCGLPSPIICVRQDLTAKPCLQQQLTERDMQQL